MLSGCDVDQFHDPNELRFYLMFLGPYFDGGSWDDRSIVGIKRFIGRWNAWMAKDGEDTIDAEAFQSRIFSYTEAFKFNKVVSEFMILLNGNKDKKLNLSTREKLQELLAIYMPK